MLEAGFYALAASLSNEITQLFTALCLLISSGSASMAQQGAVYPPTDELARPPSTQINDGTISPSARGAGK